MTIPDTANQRAPRRSGISALLAVTLVVTACAARDAGHHAAPGTSWTTESGQVSAGDCTPDDACARVTFSYPAFGNKRLPAETADALNNWVGGRLSRSFDESSRAPSPEAAGREFLEEFERATRHRPEGGGPDWFDEHKIEVIHDSDQLISLAHDRFWYTGGAHPNSTRRLATFDLESAEELALDAVLREGVETRLADLQTHALRRARDLPADANLADEGFSTDADGRVPLSRNFAVVADGWLFRWDAYEIAPYAMGPSEVTLGWKEVANLVRRGSPAGPPDPPKVADDEEDASG